MGKVWFARRISNSPKNYWGRKRWIFVVGHFYVLPLIIIFSFITAWNCNILLFLLLPFFLDVKDLYNPPPPSLRPSIHHTYCKLNIMRRNMFFAITFICTNERIRQRPVTDNRRLFALISRAFLFIFFVYEPFISWEKGYGNECR